MSGRALGAAEAAQPMLHVGEEALARLLAVVADVDAGGELARDDMPRRVLDRGAPARRRRPPRGGSAATNRSTAPAGRGRLPAWVVRMRCSLRCMRRLFQKRGDLSQPDPSHFSLTLSSPSVGKSRMRKWMFVVVVSVGLQAAWGSQAASVDVVAQVNPGQIGPDLRLVVADLDGARCRGRIHGAHVDRLRRLRLLEPGDRADRQASTSTTSWATAATCCSSTTTSVSRSFRAAPSPSCSARSAATSATRRR